MGPTSQEFNVGASGEFLWGKTTWPRGELKPLQQQCTRIPPPLLDTGQCQATGPLRFKGHSGSIQIMGSLRSTLVSDRWDRGAFCYFGCCHSPISVCLLS